MLEGQAEASGGRPRLFEIDGAFDHRAALALRTALTDGDSSRTVTLDFSRVTAFDGALALLAVSLIVVHRQGRRLAIRGLPDAARASLLHFGISVAPEGEVAFLLREELPFSD